MFSLYVHTAAVSAVLLSHWHNSMYILSMAGSERPALPWSSFLLFVSRSPPSVSRGSQPHPARYPSFPIPAVRLTSISPLGSHTTAGELVVLVGPNDPIDRGVHHPAVFQRRHQPLRPRQHPGERSGAGVGQPGLLGRERLLVRHLLLVFATTSTRKAQKGGGVNA